MPECKVKNVIVSFFVKNLSFRLRCSTPRRGGGALRAPVGSNPCLPV